MNDVQSQLAFLCFIFRVVFIGKPQAFLVFFVGHLDFADFAESEWAIVGELKLSCSHPASHIDEVPSKKDDALRERLIPFAFLQDFLLQQRWGSHGNLLELHRKSFIVLLPLVVTPRTLGRPFRRKKVLFFGRERGQCFCSVFSCQGGLKVRPFGRKYAFKIAAKGRVGDGQGSCFLDGLTDKRALLRLIIQVHEK